MDLKLGIAIGTSLLLASAQPDPEHACTSFKDLSHPCGCPFSQETFDPQCGSDGRTYLNACFFECRKTVSIIHITVDYAGVCDHEHQCECHTEYKPVCGSNGITYSNDCTLKCAADRDSSIHVDSAGVCPGGGQVLIAKDNQHEKQCPDIHGKCRKKKKNQRQLRYDDYSYDSSPPQEQEFLRPSDENFQMPPDINVEDHIIKHTTAKRPTTTKDRIASKKRCVCAELHRPVCANNHKTYPNFCVFFCVSKRDHTMELAHWGECKVTNPLKSDENHKEENEDKKPSTKCVCAAVHRPVCGNNRKTYPNFCVFLCEKEKDHRLEFNGWGECANRKVNK